MENLIYKENKVGLEKHFDLIPALRKKDNEKITPLKLTIACSTLNEARNKSITVRQNSLRKTKDINSFILEFKEIRSLVNKIYEQGLVFKSDLSEKFQASKIINISGKIKEASMVITKQSVNSNKIEIIDIFLEYARIPYNIPLDFHNYQFYIPAFKEKTLIKPDYETAKSIMKIINMDEFRWVKIDKDKFSQLLKSNIKCYFQSGEELQYLHIKELLQDYKNQHLMLAIAKSFKNDNDKFIYNKIYYMYDKDEFKSLVSEVYSYLTSDDSKEFERILSVANTVNKAKDENVLKAFNELKFRATLKPHQEIGVSWMYNLYLKGVPGCILGDKMGLGKTIQTIATLALINKTATIIAPASLTGNWEQEIKAFYPKLMNKVKIYSYESSINKQITSEIIIYDEAQKMKNELTQLATKARYTQAEFKILLTGTPLENSISDVHSLVKVIMVDSDKSLRYLSNTFRKNAVELTRKLINGIYLSREMDSSILQAKLEIKNEFLYLNEYERKVEENILRIYNRKIKNAIDSHSAFYNDAIVGFLRLRQLTSNHNSLPSDLIPVGVKYDPNVSKLNYLVKKIGEIRAKKEKAIIFIQFTPTIEIIKKALGSNKCLVIDGSFSKQERTEIVRTFQNPDSKYDIIIISLKAGATGLTLTAANHVIMYDLWWNPAVEAQAFARAYRIGQTRDVTCYRLVCKNSIIDPLVLNTIDKKISNIQAFENAVDVQSNSPKEIIDKIFGI